MKLLTFSNFIPEQLADTVRFIQYQGTFRQSHYCSYVQDFLSQVMEDPAIDGAVFPNSCDSARIAIDYLDANKKYCYQLKHPIQRDADGIRYFAQVIKEYQESLEVFFGQPMSPELMLERTGILRKRGQYLYDLYHHLEDISYSAYIEHINRMLLYPIDEWEMHTFISTTTPLPPKSSSSKPIYLIGPFLTNTGILRSIEQSGLRIVGDNLANSKRLAWNAYPCKKESIYADIAAHILQHQSSPSISGFSTLWKQDYAEIKRKKVKGVLFLCRKFCEPYDYLFVLYEARLQSAGIPLLRVYVDNDEEHSNAVFETFAEML